MFLPLVAINVIPIMFYITVLPQMQLPRPNMCVVNVVTVYKIKLQIVWKV